jgi:hypothetical protein
MWHTSKVKFEIFEVRRRLNEASIPQIQSPVNGKKIFKKQAWTGGDVYSLTLKSNCYCTRAEEFLFHRSAHLGSRNSPAKSSLCFK